MEIKKNKAVVKWVILGIAIIAIGVGGFFGYKASKDNPWKNINSI